MANQNAGSKDWTPEVIDRTFLLVAVASPFYSRLEKMLAQKILDLEGEVLRLQARKKRKNA